jgi:hypothetical protein
MTGTVLGIAGITLALASQFLLRNIGSAEAGLHLDPVQGL